MKVKRQKLGKNGDFEGCGATLSHEMRAECQKLKKICNFGDVCKKGLCVKVFVCKSVCVLKRLHVNVKRSV